MTSAGLVGGSGLVGSVGARRGNLISWINSDGYYSHFPLDPSTWKRLQQPFDTTTADSERWKAHPTAGGSIRCLVEDIGPPDPANAGFEVPVGPVGDIDSVTIDAETIETQRDGDEALFALALYLDLDGDGEFFDWKDGRGTIQHFDGFGDDGEGIAFAAADGENTFGEETEFPLIIFLPDNEPYDTWGDIVKKVGGKTDAALYVGAVGDGAGREEIVVHSMDINYK